MKILSRLLVFFLLINGFNSCTEDETSYVFEGMSAPTEVDAIFDIANDDSGEVSVTPTANGAALFRIYFGDQENESPTEVAPGETVTHVYGEGEFTLRIVAVGMTGLTSELNRIVTISFAAPTGLQVDIVQSNPLEVTVTPSAENATVYDIYFGDVENEEPTTIMDGESAVHLYDAPGDYTIRVVARGAGAATAEISEVFTVVDLQNAEAFPIGFENNETLTGVFEEFGGVTGAPVANPDTNGNSSETVYEFNKADGAPWYSGLFHIFSEDMDLSTNQRFSLKFWSPKAGINVRFQIEKEGGGGGATLFVDQTVDTANEWVTLSFDFTGIVNGTDAYDKFVIFPDFDDVGQPAGDGSIYYLDDIDLSGSCTAETEENIDPALGDINWTFQTNDFAHSFEPFGNISSAIVSNPNPSGINTSCNVQSYVKTAGCETWSGVGKGLANAIDLTMSPNRVFTMKVLAETKVTEVTLRLEFEPFPNVDPAVDVVQTISQVGVWEELVFDFSAHSDKTFKSIIVYFDRDQPCDDAVYYFDDIKQVADAGGGGGTSPSVPAPAPTQAQADVINMYSDSYTQDVNVSSWRSDWSTSTLTDIQISGNNTKEYIDADFVGVEFYGPDAVDASAMDFFHVDVWTPNATTFRVKLVDLGTGNPIEAEIAFDGISQGQWVSLDIPMADFISGGMSATNSIQQLIFSGLPTGEFDFYIDNVYFYKEVAAPTAPTVPAPDPTEAQANVINMYSNTYTQDVNVSSWRSDWSTSTLTDIQISGNDTKEYIDADFVGVEFYGADAVDASAMDFFHVDVWSPNATTFRVKLVDLGTGNPIEAEIAFDGIAQGQWVSLDIPMADFISGGMSATNSIQQLIFSGLPTGTFDFYIDNVYFYKTPPTAPTTAAPDPTEAQADVINMYSNVYTQDVNVSSWRSDWSTSTLTDIQVEGNDTKEYIDADFVGVEFYGADAVDASGMAFFHVDVWTPNATTFRVKLVDLGTGNPIEAEIAFDGIAQGQWVSLDIPMADFINGGMSATNSIQQLIFSGLPTGTFDFYIDNVYFHN